MSRRQRCRLPYERAATPPRRSSFARNAERRWTLLDRGRPRSSTDRLREACGALGLQTGLREASGALRHAREARATESNAHLDVPADQCASPPAATALPLLQRAVAYRVLLLKNVEVLRIGDSVRELFWRFDRHNRLLSRWLDSRTAA